MGRLRSAIRTAVPVSMDAFAARPMYIAARDPVPTTA
jgi:hypothetical protein